MLLQELFPRLLKGSEAALRVQGAAEGRAAAPGSPVDPTVGVQVGQPLQGTVGDGSNLHFLEWLLVNYREKKKKNQGNKIEQKKIN